MSLLTRPDQIGILGGSSSTLGMIPMLISNVKLIFWFFKIDRIVWQYCRLFYRDEFVSCSHVAVFVLLDPEVATLCDSEWGWQSAGRSATHCCPDRVTRGMQHTPQPLSSGGNDVMLTAVLSESVKPVWKENIFITGPEIILMAESSTSFMLRKKVTHIRKSVILVRKYQITCFEVVITSSRERHCNMLAMLWWSNYYVARSLPIWFTIFLRFCEGSSYNARIFFHPCQGWRYLS